MSVSIDDDGGVSVYDFGAELSDQCSELALGINALVKLHIARCIDDADHYRLSTILAIMNADEDELLRHKLFLG